jgi:hypothetical protein
MLCDKRNLAMRRQVEGGGHAGQTTADDQNVVIIQWEMCTIQLAGGHDPYGKSPTPRGTILLRTDLPTIFRKCAPKE